LLLQTVSPMIEVSIPTMEREVDESAKAKKLFRVEVLFNERKHYVLRRSSEFQTLHRKLRKIIPIPDLPSKRNPHLRTKPPEQRMQELEDYLTSSTKMKTCHRCCWTSSMSDTFTRGTRSAAWSKSFSQHSSVCSQRCWTCCYI
uniref:PX domain-containing protein n=1 Tax=Scophthalmus maximus TaxID=52904 RepID=A0A8D2ZVT4_SCOMX